MLLLISGINKIGLNVLQALAVVFTPESRGTASSIFNFIRYMGFGLAPINAYSSLQNARNQYIIFAKHWFSIYLLHTIYLYPN